MKKTVLVVEDNDNNLYLVTFLLEKRNLEVIAARDGPTGIALAQAQPPALILLDIQLPGMDGYAVAQALRAIPALNDVPIVAVSSYAMCGDRERGLAAGCNGYIEKPIDPSSFVDELMPYLEGPIAP